MNQTNDSAKPVMGFIAELENKIREKNSLIEQLKKENNGLLKLAFKTAALGMCQPYGAFLVGFALGGAVIGLLNYLL